MGADPAEKRLPPAPGRPFAHAHTRLPTPTVRRTTSHTHVGPAPGAPAVRPPPPRRLPATHPGRHPRARGAGGPRQAGGVREEFDAVRGGAGGGRVGEKRRGTPPTRSPLGLTPAPPPLSLPSIAGGPTTPPAKTTRRRSTSPTPCCTTATTCRAARPRPTAWRRRGRRRRAGQSGWRRGRASEEEGGERGVAAIVFFQGGGRLLEHTQKN